MAVAELLLELFSEEIPARMQARAAQDLHRLVTDKLKAAGLDFSECRALVTPRRLTVVVDGLPEKQPDVREERRGPRADAPDKAIQGFLGSVGLTLDQCEHRDTGKGTFLFAVVEKAGLATRDVLPDIITASVRELPWPKSMRWGRNSFRWVRPLHHVLAVFDGGVLSGGVDLGDATLTFTDQTRGHRFLAPEPVAVDGFAAYRAALEAGFVILDREDRKRIIVERARELASAEGLALRDDPGLLDEVCGLVEWPVPLIGRIDDVFMALPPEVLVTSMRSHQKYFALERPDGALADRFIVVANMASEPTRDATVVAGNEKVLRARLADAMFFWDQDRALALADRRDALAAVKFYDKLGTMADKMQRVARLSGHIAGRIGADAEKAGHAASLAKADLTTGMVGEFPELQGVMGRYYALHGGEDPVVAQAIAEHYSPLGPADGCPTAPISVAVALADKIDTLVGFFAIGETPTGSKDPFALRRAALGVIRLIIENDLRLALKDVFAVAAAHYEGVWNGVGERDPETGVPVALTRGLPDFFADRLKVHLREQGIRHDLIAAVFALGDEDDLVRLLARVAALTEFLASEDGANLLVGFRRASNILRAEEKTDGAISATVAAFADAIDSSRVELKEERDLYAGVLGAHDRLQPLLRDEAFADAMTELARLRGPIDSFFDAVTVNVDDAPLRLNRLRLLDAVRSVMGTVADFSKVEG